MCGTSEFIISSAPGNVSSYSALTTHSAVYSRPAHSVVVSSSSGVEPSYTICLAPLRGSVPFPAAVDFAFAGEFDHTACVFAAVAQAFPHG